MTNFHICHPGHNCDTNRNETTLYEVGTRIVFAANQFKDEPAESISLNVMPVFA